jgi:hypothetical protein
LSSHEVVTPAKVGWQAPVAVQVYDGVQVETPGHTLQVLPLTPQALGSLPGAQLPNWQQPPLHSVWAASPQPVSQRCVEVLQAWLLGQSVATLQPQVPLTHEWPNELVLQSVEPEQPQAAPPTQAVPCGAAVQLAQELPALPHAGCAVPARQVPPAQQPPLQMVWLAPPHAVPHWWVEVLQA